MSVRVVHGLGDLLHQADGLARRPRRAVERLGQTAPLDVFHREERPAAALANLVDLDDVRVLQPRDRRRLDTEPPQRLGLGEAPTDNHLQGDLAVEARLPGAVDNTHPSPTQLRLDLVTRHDRPRLRRRPISAPVSRARHRRHEVAECGRLVEIHRPVELVLKTQPVGELGKPCGVFPQGRGLSQVAAQMYSPYTTTRTSSGSDPTIGQSSR